MKKYFYIYVFFGILFLIWSGNYLLSDLMTSNIENKANKLPKPNLFEENENISYYQIIPQTIKKSKAYCRAYEEYYNDNFILKGIFVKLYHKIKWKLSTNPNPKQIISGDENWLFLGNHYENINETIFGIDTFNTEELNNIKMVQSERKRFLDSLGIDYYVMIAPEKSTIYKEKIPIKIDVERTKSNQVIDLLSQLGITVIFPKDTLLKSKQSLQVYYKYDSHWNANGAYIAYTQLMDSLKIKHPELQKISISDFNITTEYKNRENDLSNILFVESDWDIIPEYSLKRPLAMVNKWNDIKPQLIMQNPHGPTKKIVTFNDSYLPLIALYLGESFKEFSMCQFIGYPNFDKDLISKEHPDIVLFEVVERSIYSLGYKF